MDFLKKNKHLFVLLFIVICIFLGIFSINRNKPTFIENNIGYVLTPVQKFINSASTWVKGKFHTLNNIKKIEEENKELKIELDVKSQEIDRLKHLEIENKKLLDLLETSSRYQLFSKITANIISKDPSNWYKNFTIDKGSKDGLKKNMVILASDGLVGKIEEVGTNYSKVSSIINGAYSVSAKVLRTSDEGFIKGVLSSTGNYVYHMEYIDKYAEIKEGDEIVTSHLSEIFPNGIKIGYVKEVYLDKDNKLSKTAIIEPSVDFKHLDRVLVINGVSQ